MYNLAVDVGNSAIKYGLFTNDSLVKSGQVYQAGEVANIVDLSQVANIIVSSVRKDVAPLSNIITVKGSYFKLDYQMPVPIINGYETPHTLGMDRLAAVVGANYLYPDKDCLVIDAGTCITYDFIDKHQKFHGGSISPGLEMKFRAVHTFTQKLPLVEQNLTPVALTGQNTIAAIKSGVINGTLAEVDGIIEAYKKTSPELVVLLCGGDASFFETNLKAPIFAMPELVLIGLNRILNYNV